MIFILQMMVLIVSIVPLVVGLYAWKYLRDNTDDLGDDPPPPNEPPPPRPVVPPTFFNLRNRPPIPHGEHRLRARRRVTKLKE